MALAVRSGFLGRLQVSVQAKRFRGKINIQRPKPVHFERAKYIALTKPWFDSYFKSKTRLELCSKPLDSVKEEIDNPYQNIIARELRERFFNSRLVAFYHANPIVGDKQFTAFAAFKKENMYMKNFGKKTVEIAVKGTPFETILSFYISRNMTVFCPEPKLRELLKISKRFPEYVLYAAIFEGKLINKDEITRLGAIPNLVSAQSDLVQTLNAGASSLVHNLNSLQSNLVSQLDERKKQLEE